MILVDSNVLIDVIAHDPVWCDWSLAPPRAARAQDLPDFFIGAQAQAEGWTLLTRDSTRYRRYFPKVALICP